MKKILCLLFLCAYASATTTVTGTIQDVGGNIVYKNTYVRFWLRGCTGNQPRVNGTSIFAPSSGNTYYKDFAPNSSGVVSGTLYSTTGAGGTGDGEIECGGSLQATHYDFQVFTNGKPGAEVSVAAPDGGTIDLSNVTPLSVAPVVPAPTGDSTYCRKDSGNGPCNINGTVGSSVPAAGTFTTVDGAVGSISPSTGVFTDLTAKSVNSVINAAEYADLDAAIAASPASGGEVYMPAGTYTCPTSAITKPITLRGAGKGGYAVNDYASLLGATVLTNASLTADCITITQPASLALPGVTLSDFQIRGNRYVASATTGNGIKVNGGTTTAGAFRNLKIQDVVIYAAKQDGLQIDGNAYMVTIRDVVSVANGRYGYNFGRSSGTGVPSQIWMYSWVADLNVSNGVEIGVGVSDVYLYGGTSADSGGWGLHTATGSGSTVQWFGPHLEANTTGGILLQGGGGGHLILGGLCSGNNNLCIRVDTEGSNFFQSSAIIRGIYSETDIIDLTANAKHTCVETSTSQTTVTDNGSLTGCRNTGDIVAYGLQGYQWSLLDLSDASAARPMQQRYGNLLLYALDGVTVTHYFGSNGVFQATGGITAMTMKTDSTAIGNTGTVSMDFSLGRQFTTTPSGTMTINATNCATGQTGTLIVTTSGVTSYTLTFNTNFKSTSTLATGTASAKTFTVRFECNGTTAYETSRTAAM